MYAGELLSTVQNFVPLFFSSWKETCRLELTKPYCPLTCLGSVAGSLGEGTKLILGSRHAPATFEFDEITLHSDAQAEMYVKVSLNRLLLTPFADGAMRHPDP